MRKNTQHPSHHTQVQKVKSNKLNVLPFSECVVSLGLFGLWWTSHTLEVAIVALFFFFFFGLGYRGDAPKGEEQQAKRVMQDCRIKNMARQGNAVKQSYQNPMRQHRTSRQH